MGDWSSRLRPLLAEDIKGPHKEDDEAQGTRELSWIWLVENKGLGNPNGLLSDKDVIESA